MARVKTQPVLVILSLGQLLQTSIDESVDEFARAVQNAGAEMLFGCVSPKRSVQWALAVDESRCGRGSVRKYKKGEIDFADFRGRINHQLGINLGAGDFEKAWNAMCKISDGEFENIMALKDLERRNKIKLCVASATNACHDDYIKGQLKEKGINIPMVVSYKEGTLNLTTLAKTALCGHYQDGMKVVSLHRAIANPEMLGVSADNFSVRPVDSRIENIVQVISGMVQQEVAVKRDANVRVGNDNMPIVKVKQAGGEGAHAAALRERGGVRGFV